MDQVPFYYSVRFRFLAVDSENNIRTESYSSDFKNATPIQNRDNAFEAFDEYLDYLRKQKRLKINSRGNQTIIKPKGVPAYPSQENSLEKPEELENFLAELRDFEQYKEEISVVLVLEDDGLKQKLFSGTQENVIHRVASYSFDPQNLLDNLDSEHELYQHLKIDCMSKETVVYHFGTDYAESDEDLEGGAKRIILLTPFIWDTEEYYLSNASDDTVEASEEINNIIDQEIDYKKILAKGETNQIEFKPFFLYNVKTKKSGYSVLHQTARTICGFLNSNGGYLFLGVGDDGSIHGIEKDLGLFQNSTDKLQLEFDNLITTAFKRSIYPLVDFSFQEIDGKTIIAIWVIPSSRPVFLLNTFRGQNIKEYHIRMTASTHHIQDVEEVVDHTLNKNWNPPRLDYN